MLRHYLRTTFKHLWKRRLYSFISVLSLTLGLSIFCLTVLHVRHELSYNKGWPEAEQIYRLTSKRGGTNADTPRSTGFSDESILNLSDYLEDYTEAYTEFPIIPTQARVEGGDNQSYQMLATIDPGFTEIFQLNITEGSLERVMNASGLIAIEKEQAALLFGNSSSYLGKSVTFEGAAFIFSSDSFQAPTPTQFEIAAVYELPKPVTSSTRVTAISPENKYTERLLPKVNGETATMSTNVWMKLKPDAKQSDVDSQLDFYLDEYLVHTREDLDLRGQRYSDLFDFKLQSLNDIYFGEVPEQPSGNFIRLVTFSIIALLVLLAGSSNVISLGLATAMERRREVGVRKAVGALQENIAFQYLCESLTLALSVLIPTVILVKMLHPVFANQLSVAQMPEPGLIEYSLVFFITLVTGLMNGLYPALVLASVKPVSVLKAQAVQPRIRRLNLRSILVGMQFCFSILLLVVTTSLYVQLWITRQQPLGFNVENVAQVSFDFELLQSRLDLSEVLATELVRVPGITAVSPILYDPLRPPGGLRPVYELVANKQEDSGSRINRVSVKPGLFDLLEIPLLSGRDLDSVRDMPVAPTAESGPTMNRVLINRMTLEEMGFTDPQEVLGQQKYLVSDYGSGATHIPIEIIGVVEDSMLSDIRQRPVAQVYYLEDFGGLSLLYRYEPGVESEISQRVSATAQEVIGTDVNSSFLKDQLDQAFTREERESRLLLVCAGLSLFLSCIGLYGLVTVALKTQIKEIGVRKVLGSTTRGVVSTFLKRFSVPVVAANLVAWPLGIYFVLKWIQQFPYQLEKAWLLPICVGTTLVVLAIAWITVGALTWRAASTRPVKSLRYE